MISSSILGLFQSFFNHEIVVNLNLPMFPVLVRRREKLKTTLISWLLSRFYIHSNPTSALDAMNF